MNDIDFDELDRAVEELMAKRKSGKKDKANSSLAKSMKIEPVAIPIVGKLHDAQKEFFYILTYNITEEEYQAMETVLNKMNQNIIDQFEE